MPFSASIYLHAYMIFCNGTMYSNVFLSKKSTGHRELYVTSYKKLRSFSLENNTVQQVLCSIWELGQIFEKLQSLSRGQLS